ncbi:MAG: zinc-dependent alcohol dehydrogenase family protein [Pseudomonadota bacterium]
MRAVVFETFGQMPDIRNVTDPSPEADGVVLQVGATGVCRSDWHGWMGHDTSIALPHVPGHELAGTIVAKGAQVERWQIGEKVTVPFAVGCGQCPQCAAGHQQVCDNQFQPGFSHWGSFAEYVAINHADMNLVALPETMTFATAASLGCRFATAYRAIVDQGRVLGGEWVAVHGCGGVGLSAIMIASALGARVVGVDLTDDKLALARTCGAEVTILASSTNNIAKAVREATGGGAHLSIDALGSPVTCVNSISSLRKRGRHVQVGLMLADEARPPIPMDRVIAHELEIVGSHGMQAHRYTDMIGMIEAGSLTPQRLLGQEITLSASITALTDMNSFDSVGATVITDFTQ